jgi:hypothetical protein
MLDVHDRLAVPLLESLQLRLEMTLRAVEVVVEGTQSLLDTSFGEDASELVRVHRRLLLDDAAQARPGGRDQLVDRRRPLASTSEGEPETGGERSRRHHAPDEDPRQQSHHDKL